MPALNFIGSKERVRESSVSQTDQAAEQSVLPPFSGKLSVDEKLKLRNETFKQSIENFFKDKHITPLSQLTATPPFPTPYVLAQFASKSYINYETEETDAQYEARLALPDGWTLLTTASNTGMSNCYFGAAYWHPEHQHVVIAHRGNVFTNLGPTLTEMSGVLFKHHVPQMDSASTIAYKVVEVLREVNHEKGTNFQVFFTGHSLGGWLAQITTFTTEYLKVEGNTFLKSDNVPHSYHPHTVVFDSPGCKDMLSQMADTFDVRLDGRSIDLEHLDITSYLSAPNRINTCNAHLGTVYLVFTGLSDNYWQKQHTALYKLCMGKIVDVFDPKTGQVRKDLQGQLKVQVVIDWPVSSGLYCSEEHKHFFKWAKDLNNYHSEIRDVSYLPNGCYPIRYQTKNYDEHVTSINILRQEERQFLEDYRRLCQLPEFFKPKEIFTAIGNEQAQKQAEIILQGFEIKNETIRCTDVSALQALIPYVKRLLQRFPEIKENTKCALSKAEQNVLPPFSGKLTVDEELKLSNETFEQTIDVFLNNKIVTAISQLTATPAFHIPYALAQFASKAYKEYEKLKLSHESFKQTFDDFLKEKSKIPLSPLKATPVFPTPYVLAQFASKAYTSYKRRETDAQYETRLDLPDGWKLLTTASNTGWNNGYFGAAYWHPEHQQVVIAHRGTEFTILGAIFSDISGVLFKHHVPQMGSASTFAYKVVEVLREVNHEKGTNFQVFFTGHSLGGWLAQITTFTTEYLKIVGNTFLKSDNVPHSYHPHTVVFDSPGCKDMLSQMADTFDVRHDGRSIDLQHLDITSYLSAPNRINTCNKHVGTVYRVFTDLSDMPWWKKFSAFYNFPAHSMGRIVQVFDPESGQVLKDENGQFKLQVVIDWPLSAGLSRGKEYKRFFKWAKHLNNYHAKIEDVRYPHDCYHTIRYQTKEYDERVTSISIFSQEERQFLEDYRRLCQLPEFFKPKEMFTAIGNEQVQKQAEIILQGFEIKNETIRCTDVSALQAHIPYVKRLLQLFPEIKEITKCALSPHEIRNNVYQIGTKRYLEKLHQSPLDFKPDALSFTDFLNSDEQNVLHLGMVDGDAWTGLIKAYQVLNKTHVLNEGHYTVLTLQHLLLVNPMVNLNTLMQSTTTPHLLIMACETDQLSDDETKQIFEGLFNTLRHKSSVKIVLTTQSKDDFRILQDEAQKILSNGFVTRVEQLNWSDLTLTSQEKLLENTVNFQGSEIALNQLISSNSPVTNLIPLADLLGRHHIKIGKEPVAHSKCDSYDERYYIERTFHHKVIIKKGVLNDNREQTFCDVFASTEQEFKQICQLNPESNVHWLELVWQQTKGSLETLRKYIDTDSSHTYTPDDLDKLLEQAHKHRLMLISDTAGMGKSTVLTHLSKQIKQKFPAKWVVRIDLNDHTDALQALKVEQIDKEKANEFLSEKILKLETGLEVELFKQCCEQKQKVNIVIMLDGFDEISPNYKDIVIALLQALRQTAVEQLWVTTRPHLRQELEDKLQQLSYTLESFSEENQVEYLKKFWSLKDWFTEIESKEEEEKKVKLAIYAKRLIKKLAQSISDKDKGFTGIPLQCRMLAEAFDEEVKTFCQSAESVPQLPFKLDLLGLYGTFIDKKYGIIQKERLEVCESKVFAKEQKQRELQSMRQDHLMLALKLLFTEEHVTLLHNNSQCNFSAEKLARFGIVQLSDDGKPHFIHHTFAEYYVAEFLVNQLTKGSNTSQVQDILFQKILLEENYRVIRVFIDGLLSRCNPQKEELKQYGKRISDICGYGLLILHQSALEGNAYIIGFLLECLQAGGHTDIVHDLLLAQEGDDGDSAWHAAAKGRQPQVLQELWKWGKEILTADELSNKFLLQENKEGKTAWHFAAEEGNIEIFEKLWEWSKELLFSLDWIGLYETFMQRKYYIFFEKNFKIPVSNVGAELTRTHLLAHIIQDHQILALKTLFGEEQVALLQIKSQCTLQCTSTDEDLTRIGIVHVSDDGKVHFIHRTFAEYYVAEFLVNQLTKQSNTSQQVQDLLLQKIFLEEDYGVIRVFIDGLLSSSKPSQEVLTQYGNRISDVWGYGVLTLHRSALEGNAYIIVFLLESLQAGGHTDIVRKVLLGEGFNVNSAWHVAAKGRLPQLIQKLWEWGKMTLTAEELRNKLLLVKDNKERTAWHYASQSYNAEALQKLWECSKETLTAEELSNKLLLAKDKRGQTAWHYASQSHNAEALQKQWECGKETLTAEELNTELLLAKDKWGQTAWHLAAREGNITTLEKVWECGKETLTAEELSNKLLLAKDNDEQTAWNFASRRGHVQILNKLWEWGKETLTAEDLNTEFLLAKDNEERTAWHYASEWDKLEVLQKLWECGKETLTAEELNNKLLLAKDNMQQTAWHLAAKAANTAVLEKLCDWAKEVKINVKHELRVAKNNEGKTVLVLVQENGLITESEKLKAFELIKNCF